MRHLAGALVIPRRRAANDAMRRRLLNVASSRRQIAAPTPLERSWDILPTLPRRQVAQTSGFAAVAKRQAGASVLCHLYEFDAAALQGSPKLADRFVEADLASLKALDRRGADAGFLSQPLPRPTKGGARSTTQPRLKHAGAAD